jgi:hypothetical protein
MTTKAQERSAIIEAIKSIDGVIDALYVKNIFMVRYEDKSIDRLTFAQARKLTSIKASLQRNSYDLPKTLHPLAYIAKAGI